MASEDVCSKCGKPLPEEQNGLVCRVCLLRAVIDYEPESMEDELPSIEGYDLIEEVGRGGVGQVYRARQHEPNREVALKLVLNERVAGEEARSQFLQEVEFAAQLEHPAITPIYETGRDSGFLFFSSRLMAGGDLSQHLDDLCPYIERGPRQRRIAEIIERLAQALHYAHQRGVIHQDVKTANILLDENEEPYLSDFGLASQAHVGLDGPSGKLSGSPSYMAPEQLESGVRSAAVDIYALGVVLYELLTGRPPFEASSLSELFQKIHHEVAVFDEPGLDPTLCAICLRCLKKKPATRYPSARALASDLRNFLELKPTMAKPLPFLNKLSLWCRRRPAQAVMTMALLAALALAAVLQEKRNRESESARQYAEQEERESRHRLASQLLDRADESGREQDYQLAVNDLLEAATLTYDDLLTRQLSLDLLAAWSPSLPGVLHRPSGLYMYAELSPDGSEAVSWSLDSMVSFWNLENEPFVKKTWQAPAGAVADVSYDFSGERLAISTDHDVTLIDSESGESLHVFPRSKNDALPESFDMPRGRSTFHPNAQLLGMALRGDDVVLWDLETMEKKHVFAIPDDLSGEMMATLKVDFYDDLMIVAWRGGCLIANCHDGGSFFIPAEKRVEGVGLSPWGQFLAIGDKDAKCRVYRTSDGELVGEGEHLSWVTDVAFSPDGRWLLSASRDRGARLWAVEEDGSLHEEAKKKHPAAVVACRWLDDAGNFVTSCEDGLLRYYKIGSRRFLTTQRIVEGRPRSWDLHEGSSTMIVGSERGFMSYFSLPNPPDRLTDLPGEVREMRIDPVTGEWVGISDYGEGFRGVTRWKGGQLIRQLDFGFRPEPYSMSLSRDGRCAIAADAEGGVSVWDTASGLKLWAGDSGLGVVTRTAIVNCDGNQIVAVLGDDERLAIFRTDHAGGAVVYQLKDSPPQLRFSPDGTLLALGYPSGEVVIFPAEGKVASPRVLSQAHSNQVIVLEFNSAGTLLASGGMDKKVWIHDLKSGEPTTDPLLHDDYVWTLAFSADGRYLASGGQEHAVRFFHVQTGWQLGKPRYQSSWINGLCFRDDDLLACGRDLIARRISLPPRSELSLREWRKRFPAKKLTK